MAVKWHSQPTYPVTGTLGNIAAAIPPALRFPKTAKGEQAASCGRPEREGLAAAAGSCMRLDGKHALPPYPPPLLHRLSCYAVVESFVKTFNRTKTWVPAGAPLPLPAPFNEIDGETVSASADEVLMNERAIPSSINTRALPLACDMPEYECPLIPPNTAHPPTHPPRS